MRAYLIRIKEDDEGTLGILSIPELGYSCYTTELPDRDNMTNISRIPAGNYTVQPYSSKAHKKAFQVMNVEDRGKILIHVGNWSGDTSKGYISDSEGCILVGNKVDILNNQRAVLNSVDTLKELNRVTKRKGFKLTIISYYEE